MLHDTGMTGVHSRELNSGSHDYESSLGLRPHAYQADGPRLRWRTRLDGAHDARATCFNEKGEQSRSPLLIVSPADPWFIPVLMAQHLVLKHFDFGFAGCCVTSDVYKRAKENVRVRAGSDEMIDIVERELQGLP